MKPNLLLKDKDDGDCAHSFHVFPHRPLSECSSVSADAIPLPSSSSIPRHCFLWTYFSLISATASIMDIPTSGVRKNKPVESLWRAKVLCSAMERGESTRNEMLAPCGSDQNTLDGVRVDCIPACIPAYWVEETCRVPGDALGNYLGIREPQSCLLHIILSVLGLRLFFCFEV